MTGHSLYSFSRMIRSRARAFRRRFSLALVGVGLLVTVASGSLLAQSVQQEIRLEAGWNSVWLEVEPTYPLDHPTQPGMPMSPEDAFNTAANANILRIVSPRQIAGLAEFSGARAGSLDGETVNAFNQAGWESWRRDPQGSPNSLVMVTGNRPYLIQTRGQRIIRVRGRVRFARPEWVPDRYNLLGFGITGSVTFQEFFDPAGATHPLDRIYSLGLAGRWKLVDPGDLIRNDTAYWIFCNGPSGYMGPVALDFDGAVSGRLGFGSPADAVEVGAGVDAVELDLEEIVFTNLRDLGGTGAFPELQLEAFSTGGLAGELELHVVHPVPDSLEWVRGNQVDSDISPAFSDLGEAVAPQASSVLTLGARRNWDSGAVDRTLVYRIRTGGGSEFWLPVTALRNDLQSPGDMLPENDVSRVAGLWVGDVSVGAVTSIVKDGAPVEASAGSAPLRILLHSDGNGVVLLLSQVTLMQTRSADASAAVEPVLVVDAAKIPVFEGIQERNGKRVGVRLEAVTYDMPRKLDAVSQAGLLNDPAYQPGLIPGGILDFLTARATRPPTLAEVYHLTWPMEGAIGVGKTVRTSPGRPLVLDPFHRSNPFRHAYHQSHPRGPNIQRWLNLEFDPNPSADGRLRGKYTEVMKGLIQSEIRTEGTFLMQRVSTVAHLE